MRWKDAAGSHDVAGVTLPGAPLLVVGSNGHVAWGFTNAYGQWFDWVEVPRDAKLVKHEEVLAVHGGGAQTLVVEDLDGAPVVATEDQRRFALHWVAHEGEAYSLVLDEMLNARHVSDALSVAQRAGIYTAHDYASIIKHMVTVWNITGRSVCGAAAQAQDVEAGADRREGIPQFMGQGRQELVLAAVGVQQLAFRELAVVDVQHQGHIAGELRHTLVIGREDAFGLDPARTPGIGGDALGGERHIGQADAGMVTSGVIVATMSRSMSVAFRPASVLPSLSSKRTYLMRSLALDQAPPVHAGALLDFFTFGYVAGSNAIFEGMHRLDPGTALIIDLDSNSVTAERYWQWPDGSVIDTRSEDEVIEALRHE